MCEPCKPAGWKYLGTILPCGCRIFAQRDHSGWYDAAGFTTYAQHDHGPKYKR